MDQDEDGTSLFGGDCDDEDPKANLDDEDGDRLSSCAGDCDDSDPAVRPGMPEICDGLDSDCDGWLPESEVDADKDGFPACAGDCDDKDRGKSPADEDGDGVSTCGGDCDDFCASCKPGAAEIPGDWMDNDCDGETDEAEDASE